MSTRTHRGSGRDGSNSFVRRFAASVSMTCAIATYGFVTITSFADTVYVPDDYTTIQQAIDAVADDDEIIVRPGEYNEAIDLLGKRIYLHSEAGIDDTELIGTGLNASLISAISGETLDTVIEGFMIRDGSMEQGGGMRIGEGSGLTVRQCRFAFNEATYDGSCAWINDGEVAFEDCAFDNNDQSAISAELADVQIERCTFELNIGSSGAAIDGSETALVIEDSTFRVNASWGFGGAIRLNRGALAMARSTFTGNASIMNQSGGGAMYLANLGDVVINDCAFEDNRSGSGGAIDARDLNLNIRSCRFSGNEAFGFEGGAIQAENGNLAIADSQFRYNCASSHAGAVAASVSLGTTLLIERCSFENNSCYYDGGALNIEVRDGTEKVAFVRECNFEDNAAIASNSRAGAAYSYGGVAYESCTFERNHAATGGAAAACETNDDWQNPTLDHCVFANNTASYDGGAITQENGSLNQSLISLGCIFDSNHAGESGGAAWFGSGKSYLVNAAVYANTSGVRGGAVYKSSNADLEIHNCTVVYNGSAGIGGGVYSYDGSTTLIANSIVYGNASGQIAQRLNETVVQYSNVEGDFNGAGNIEADPIFVNVDDFDLRLSNGSPCIDAGNSNLVPEEIEFDLLGNMRMVDDPGKFDNSVGTHPAVDMGAIEYQQTSVFSLTILPLPIVGGEQETVRVDNAQKDRMLWVFYGLAGLGETFVPPLNVTLDLSNARLALSGRTDAEGVFQKKLDAPLGIGNRSIWLQAAQVGGTSNYVGTRGAKE